MSAASARFTDPASPAFGATSALAFGALSLVEPARLPPARRAAYRAALAATTAWWTAVTTDPERTVHVPGNVVAGAAAGGACWALADFSETLDARLMDRLHAAGVEHPRRWTAGIAAAAVLAACAVDRYTQRQVSDQLPEESPRTRPLAPTVRTVIRGILQAVEMPGSAELLAQLEAARERYLPQEHSDIDGENGIATLIELDIPDQLARVVPHTQTYPVHARFPAPDGTPLQITLYIEHGQLAHTTINPLDATDDTMDSNGIGPIPVPFQDFFELPDQWPDPTTLHYVCEHSDGTAHPLTPHHP